MKRKMAYSSRCLAVVVVLTLVLCSSPAPVKAISCTQALEYLLPCQTYLLGIGEISSACCLGARAVAQAAASQADRKSICQCLKQVALSANVDPTKAGQLPQLCKIDIPFVIQPNIDCDQIPMRDLCSGLNGNKCLGFEAHPPKTQVNDLKAISPSSSPTN